MNEADRELRELITQIPARLATQSQDGEVRFVKLTDDMYRSRTPAGNNAVFCDEDGEPTERECKVFAKFQRSYYFADDVVRVRKADEKWQIDSPGITYIGGNTNGPDDIPKGGVNTVTLANGKSVVILAFCGKLGGNKKFGAMWDDHRQGWESDPVEC